MQRARQLYRAASAHIVFVTGTPTSVREGSGTYVGISALRDALLASGVDVMLIAPGEQQLSAIGRLWFNYRARTNSQLRRSNVMVGFDLDGVFIAAGGALDVACIKGVIAEELKFEKGLQRLRLLLQSYFEKRRVRNADRVLTTSHYAAESIEKHYGVLAEQISIVPELIDLRRWQTALQQAHRESRSEASILCVDHLYRRKDVATLLRAMARLQSPAVLRIVGVGPELARLRRLARKLDIEGRVKFLGHVSFVELAQEYRSADIFCFPSRQEGFGIVLLEAMAAGLPVIASRTTAIPEIVLDRQSGLLVEPGDVAGFATAMDELLQSPMTRERLGRAGLERVALYDAPLVAHQFLMALGINSEAA